MFESTLAPRLGGREAAETYLRLLSVPNQHRDLTTAVGEARRIGNEQKDDDAYRRWVWLQNRLFQYREMLQK